MKIMKLMAVGVAAVLLLAACGGDDGDDNATGGGGDEEVTLRLWLNGPDTPDDLVDFAISEFEADHPNVTVEFERQQWDGLVERLATALSSGDSPDIVEMGNTQAQGFEAAGALVDLTDHRDELGGDDLVQSLVESGTYNG